MRGEGWVQGDSGMYDYNGILALLNNFATQKPQTQEGWVSRIDKQPTDSRMVLVSEKRTGLVTTGYFHNGEWLVDAIMNVTHWQELPPPPTNEQKQ